MEKINIAELLKNCPIGMELDCTMYEDVYFDYVDELNIIHCYIQNEGFKTSITFNQHGTPNSDIKSKCVIFPKGKNTWEGFVPCKFKDGDIVATEIGSIFIYNKSLNSPDYFGCYVGLSCLSRQSGYLIDQPKIIIADEFTSKTSNLHLATEEEKQKLFDAIKANGYRWNAETKTLDKLPEFKDGDIIFAQYYDLKYVSIVKQIDRSSNIHVYCLYGFTDSVFAIDEILGSLKESLQIRFATEIEKQKLFQSIKDNGYKWNSKNKTLEKLIKPIFKVGDRIRRKNNTTITKTIGYIYSDSYALYDGSLLYFKEQDEWELVPNKFDINTLKPFDKVLVRNTNNGKWCGQFYMDYNKNEDYPFECTYNCWKYCIPYEGNEHLRGTTDDCNNFYKTWE